MDEKKVTNPHEERVSLDFTGLTLGQIIDRIEEAGGISGSQGHYEPEEAKKLIAKALEARKVSEEEYQERLLRLTSTGHLRSAVREAINALPATTLEKDFSEAQNLEEIFSLLDQKQMLAGSARVESARAWQKQIQGMIRLPEVLGKDRPNGVPPVPITESLLSVITNRDGLRDAVRRILFGPAYVAQYEMELEKRQKS